MSTAGSLYIQLVLRLRADCARAATALLAARDVGEEPVADSEILAWPAAESGRWHARLNRPGWYGAVTSDSSQGYASETEAFCSLIEVLERRIREENGFAPPHLLDLLVTNASALAVYRTQTARLLRGALAVVVEVADALDEVAEGPLTSAETTALRQLLAPGPDT